MRKIVLLLCAMSCVSSAIASPATDLFDQASRFMVDHYHGYSGVKPLEIATKLRPKLEAVCKASRDNCSFQTARPFVAQLAQSMNDGHTYFLSPQSFENWLNEFSGQNTITEPLHGFWFSNVNSRGEVLINHVTADSPAAIAGIRPFDRIIGVGNELLERSNALQRLRALLNSNTVVNLRMARGDTRNPVQLEVTLQPIRLRRINLPLLYQPANAPAGVLVMRFPTFVGSNDIAPRTHELVARAIELGAKSIIIDVRGNPGGEETECYGAASAFIGRAANINETRLERIIVGFDGGTLLGNDPKDPKKYNIQQPMLWKGDVAVLADRGTASCGELMAYLLQYNKRAKVIGEATVGMLDTATEAWELMDQSALAITYVRTLNPDGTRLPAKVTPDVAISSSLDEIAETGRDLMLDKALEILSASQSN